MTWDECLLTKAKEIVKHGQGKLNLNVGPSGVDETNILIEAQSVFGPVFLTLIGLPIF